MVSNLRERAEDLYQRGVADNNRAQRILGGLARGTLDLGHGLVADQCLGAASGLAFTTILSLVPLLAVFFAIFRAFAQSDLVGNALTQFLTQSFLADSVSEVVPFIEQFLERARGGTVGLIGFLFLTVTSVSLFLSIEQAINRIWRVPAARPFYKRITTFYSVVTLSPILLGLSFVVATWLRTNLAAVPFGGSLITHTIPWMLASVSLTMLYKLMPHTRVAWRPAVLAALIAAAAFEITKLGFNYYVSRIYSGSVNSQIYGSFALVPIFFLWVYSAWIIILAGVQISYFIQNRALISEQVLARRGRHDQHKLMAPTGYLTARAFFEVARRFRRGGGGTRLEEVSSQLQVPSDDLLPIVRLLKDAGLVLLVENSDSATELVPAQPLDRVTLAQLYELPDAQGYQTGQLPATGPALALDEKLRAGREGLRQALAVDVESLLATEVVLRRPERVSTRPPPVAR